MFFFKIILVFYISVLQINFGACECGLVYDAYLLLSLSTVNASLK